MVLVIVGSDRGACAPALLWLVCLDRAVDKCYRGAAFGGELERLEYLFGLYNKYTEPLIKAEKKKGRRWG